MRKMEMRMASFLAIGLLLASLARAEEQSAALQVEMQTAMLTYTESIFVDGSYSYIDTQADALKTVYLANVHPFVLTMGSDFVVCSEMIDDTGNSITADFLVRRIEGKYKVVQMLLDDRESLKNAMSKLRK
jgi:hypothetical protein